MADKVTGFAIKNPQYNASHELIAFDGIKLVNGQLDKTDKASMDLVEKVKKLPRLQEYTGKSAPRIKVGDDEYGLSYKFFTDQERLTYQEYRKNHTGTGGSSNRGSSIGDRKTFDMLTKMIDKYSKKKEFAEVVEDLKAQRKLYMTALSRDELMELLLAGNL
jgi:hypothetical protein